MWIPQTLGLVNVASTFVLWVFCFGPCAGVVLLLTPSNNIGKKIGLFGLPGMEETKVDVCIQFWQTFFVREPKTTIYWWCKFLTSKLNLQDDDVVCFGELLSSSWGSSSGLRMLLEHVLMFLKHLLMKWRRNLISHFEKKRRKKLWLKMTTADMVRSV